MCLIIIGEMAEESILRSADIGNPHGVGVAWQTKSGVEYKKDLTVSDLLALPDEVKKYCVVHFRLATAGGKDKDLIHPFPIEPDVPLCKNGTADRLVMHNGHISTWESMAKNIKGTPTGPMSDSRLVAYLVWKYGSDILYLFSGQRFVTMSRKKILMYGDWTQEGERYYSNTSYRYKRGEVVTSGEYRKPVAQMTTAEWDTYCEERYGKRYGEDTWKDKTYGPKGCYGQVVGGPGSDKFRERGTLEKGSDGIYRFTPSQKRLDEIADKIITDDIKILGVTEEEVEQMWGGGEL